MQEVYARAIPKIITLTETYCYEQEISRNPYDKEIKNPVGKIEIVQPYDGGKYFPKHAIKDVEKQIGDNTSVRDIHALIGYLAISGYDETDLHNLLSQDDSIPLRIPVGNLRNEQLYCLLNHEYCPESPELLPIQVNAHVLDDDIILYNLPLPQDLLTRTSSWSHKELAALEDKVIKLVRNGFTFGDSSLANRLMLFFQVRLSLPINQLTKTNPKIHRLSLSWPTSTSSSNLKLAVDSLLNPSKNLSYNPLSKCLEWFDVEFKFKKNSQIQYEINGEDEQTQIGIWESSPMYLLVGQPSELYQENILKGEVNVEIPEYLLSGIQARFYGFNKVVGELEEKLPSLSTSLITHFNLILDDAFQKRAKSASLELKLDKILPDQSCIRDIVNELNTQGFSVLFNEKLPDTKSNGEKNLTWIISAEKSEGIDSITLWIVVHGSELEIISTIQGSKSEHMSKDRSGNLSLYLFGKYAGSSHILTKKMKTLQEELRRKFEGRKKIS